MTSTNSTRRILIKILILSIEFLSSTEIDFLTRPSFDLSGKVLTGTRVREFSMYCCNKLEDFLFHLFYSSFAPDFDLKIAWENR